MINFAAAPVVSYEFEPGKRSIFAEIYFPKKVAYQGAIAEKRATRAGHLDVYRAILYWVMSVYGHTDYSAFWSDGEMKRFLARHGEWDSGKRRYAKRHYSFLRDFDSDRGLFFILQPSPSPAR